MSLLFHHGAGVGLSCLLGGSTAPKTLAKCVLPGEGLGTPLWKAAPRHGGWPRAQQLRFSREGMWNGVGAAHFS